MERITDAAIDRLAAMPTEERREALKSVSLDTVLAKCRDRLDDESITNLHADAVWLDMSRRFETNFVIEN